MSYRIEADEVRNRLRTMLAVEVTDTVLNSTSFIPMSEAWIDTILSQSSATYASLSTTKQTLIKAAQIARCAWTVLSAAPKESYKAGLTDFRGLDAKSVELAMTALENEWSEALALCGAGALQVGGASTGGDDYQSDLEDLTNISWSDTTGDLDYSRFA